MYVSAIVLAAGKGKRFKSDISKPLVKIGAKPIIFYSLRVLSRNPEIKDIILVANRGNRKGINAVLRKYRINKIKAVVLGGKRRQDSVLNGLKAIGRKGPGLVLIHDSARPFIDRGIISSVIRQAKRSRAAIAGVPVKATIKEVTRSPGYKVTDSFIVKKTLDRGDLWEIQTPQVFKKDWILSAYQKFGGTEVTDDASLVEKSGHKVSLVKGSYFNIKITTPEDLVLAEAILKSCKL